MDGREELGNVAFSLRRVLLYFSMLACKHAYCLQLSQEPAQALLCQITFIDTVKNNNKNLGHSF